MSCNKIITIVLTVAAITFSGAGAVYADEVQPKLSDEPSLFERYRSGAKDLVLKGLELVGIKYRRGGTDPDSGLDCSGFVQLVFKDAIGMLLPRTAKEQSQVGDVIDKKELKPGDLVFFNTLNRSYSHVGIYIGDARFVHAPATNGKVRIDRLSDRYYAQRFEAAGTFFE